jgi:hypothetical protein
MSGVALQLILEVLPHPPHLRKNAAGMFQQPGACGGQYHAAPIALEQRLTELEFQLAYLSAQGRLHHGQERGRAGEAAELGYMPEVLELFQVHGP